MLSSKSYHAQQKWSEQMEEVRLSHQFWKILAKLRGSWPPRRCYCIKNNWFTLMEKWYGKVKKPHMEIRITSFMLVLCCIRRHCCEKPPHVFSCLLIPRSKCLSQWRKWTSMCSQSDFHSRDTLLIKVKGGAFHGRSAYYGTTLSFIKTF